MSCAIGVWLFLPIVGIIFLVVMPSVVKFEIKKYMKLEEGSTLYEAWSETRNKSYTEFYIFTVLNPAEVMQGQKPALYQLGPYVYRQSTSKANLSFHNNGTLCYSEKNVFIFDPALSLGNESDNVTMINLAYVGIAGRTEKYAGFIKFILQLFESYYHSQLFITKTVKEVIWGYEDPVLKALSKFITISPTIGLYVGKNATIGSVLEIDDGSKDLQKIGRILYVNGKSNTSVWKTADANKIDGSDGSLFPPFLTSASQVHVYSEGICRSLVFDAGPPTTVNGVTTIRFILSNGTLLSPDLNDKNRGYCLDYPICPKSGVIDMRTCMDGAPILISLPHFNQADQSYRDGVIGMSPRPDMGISIMVEPQTGAVLEAFQMIQVNAIVTQSTSFTALKHVTNVTLPIGYINSSVFVDVGVAEVILHTLVWPQLVCTIISILLIIGGAWGLLFAVLQLTRRRCCSRTPDSLVTPLLNDASVMPDEASNEVRA